MKQGIVTWGMISIGVLVLIFVIVGSVAKDDVGSEPVEVTADAPAPETVLTSENEQQLQAQIAELIKAGEVSACDQVDNDMYRKVCRNNIVLKKAYESGDVAYCQQLDGDLVPPADCERQVVTTRSVDEEDITICDLASEEEVKNMCRENFAEQMSTKKNDVTLCELSPVATKCSDAFYLQNFLAGEMVGCSVFSTAEAQADCTALMGIPSDADDEVLKEFCDTKQSDLFSSFCASALRDPMTRPEGVQLPQ